MPISVLPCEQVIRCLLIVPFPESSLNDEAGKLFMESYSEYERRVKVWVSVHASKSLSGDGDCDRVSSGGAGKSGAGGTKGSVVKGVSGSSTASSGRVGARGAAGTGGVGADGAGGGAEKTGDGAGTGGTTSKRREEAPRKSAKDRQKEAKKRGLKRL